MSEARPNILLIVTDGQRADALGIDGHPVLQTPYLDALAAEGVRFKRAYSACPVSVAARRTIMTGTRPSTHGVIMNHNTALDLPTLPAHLAGAGYHTHSCGKLNLHPPRKLYGFHSLDHCDRPVNRRGPLITDDYQRYLIENGFHAPNAGMIEGGHQNGWLARPFAYPEQHHLTNWTIDRALRFLERRDPTAPFFLHVGLFAPHAPCCPPAYYFEKYMSMDLPDPVVGDWARVFDAPQAGSDPAAWRTYLPARAQREFMAGYFGAIEHLDHQIGRLLQLIPSDTVVMFVSDHGDMLGDHQWMRKRSGFEGAARIPFILSVPQRFAAQPGVRTELVGLEDVMPTLLDICDVAIPSSVDGTSVVPVVQGKADNWRRLFHGECCRLETLNSGMQYLTDECWKYIYYPARGEEQLFDLQNDPRELREVSDQHPDVVSDFRDALTGILSGRPENFVQNSTLTPIGGPSAECRPE